MPRNCPDCPAVGGFTAHREAYATHAGAQDAHRARKLIFRAPHVVVHQLRQEGIVGAGRSHAGGKQAQKIRHGYTSPTAIMFMDRLSVDSLIAVFPSNTCRVTLSVSKVYSGSDTGAWVATSTMCGDVHRW